MTGANLFFKCENFQKGGSFKTRGATNTLLSLSQEERNKGVVTHSSGNHAGAIARVAKNLNMKAYLVMPDNSPKTKVEYVKSQNGIIIESTAEVKSREKKCQQIMDETGAIFIPPFNDYRIICGQASVSYEIFQKLDDIDFILTPISGGGLFSGQCLTSSYISPKTKMIGVEPYLARDAYLSLKEGKMHPQLPPKTIADGLRMPLGDKTFDIIQKYAHDILLVEEQEIIEATNLIWKIMKIIVEPSSATVLAAVLKNKQLFQNKKIALVISGGNVDISI
ncbi:Tryptophan synthase beta subunit-like PLP-dependent enzymes superfamily [Pseudocohnilembus persalinus]|uniref:Tryptophan synthase beta subunit-like PLP-dependent enzymes superfamily n=1 Tax=Pseudocohnilembus persalinus TaxID=266149 RepID=A0A0V0QPU2_PSEPJ|nr:Tryptophan synthase beta subunit-like PLP-dependent enzymes superfamily [Pseudocohnilembus persalinus]|eukprot:KRX04350.1 Tryptophan synthase beta subunit-like PLP-dependent enzymes superfamily [Pseudocohnilembus persalinus]